MFLQLIVINILSVLSKSLSMFHFVMKKNLILIFYAAQVLYFIRSYILSGIRSGILAKVQLLKIMTFSPTRSVALIFK